MTETRTDDRHRPGIPAFAVGDSIARAHAEYAGDCRLCSV